VEVRKEMGKAAAWGTSTKKKIQDKTSVCVVVLHRKREREREREISLARREAVDEMDLQLRDSVRDTGQTHCALTYYSGWQSFISAYSRD
jgi:hypothetical protein